MSHIYVYSPSSAQRDKASFRRGIKRLESLGHAVEMDQDALATHMRFAGDDATRLAAIHRAAASGADVAMISRGGYGLNRLLADINYKAVHKAIDKGMSFVGYSDFTAFQCAVLARTGGVTWVGPTVGEDFGVAGEPDDIMEACFDDLVRGQGEGAGWRLPRPRTPADAVAGATGAKQLRLPGTGKTIRDAVLWGGNLAVLTSLLGTPYFPAVKSGILFLEDVAEHPYRIERMLSQLLHAGVLAQQKAIVLGQFTRYKATPNDKGYKLQTAVDWMRGKLKIPVLENLPFGHVPTKVVLPFGASVELLVEDRDALLYWGHSH
ncbi:MAG: LD-carboxypeptidase [Rhodoferax sp.]|nr:LD-carboxypeptidase [Rhodoferax sp.]